MTTVGDFRVADMAVSGQGAPLVPYLDEIILKRRFEETRRVGMLLNIGGISNISAIVPCTNTTGEGDGVIKYVYRLSVELPIVDPLSERHNTNNLPTQRTLIPALSLYSANTI